MGEVPRWLAGAVKEFGAECAKKLAGPGEPEAAIRTPLEQLLRTAGPELGVQAVFHDEVRDTERRVRPDYGVSLAPGMISALSRLLRAEITSEDVLAYIAGVTAHPAFTRTFADELTTPGIRIPVTTDAELWARAADLGRQVLWLHTYGQCFTGEGRPAGDVRLPVGDLQRPLSQKPLTALPETLAYDEDRQTIVMGDGEFGPVTRQVWDYAVGGRKASSRGSTTARRCPAAAAARRSTTLTPRRGIRTGPASSSTCSPS